MNQIPQSRIAFRGLVQELQEIGATGAVGTLLKIAPLFIEISRAAEDAARANKKLFKTRADQVFAQSGPVQPYNNRGSFEERETINGESRLEATMRDILHEIRNGNVTNAKNTYKTAKSLDRIDE